MLQSVDQGKAIENHVKESIYPIIVSTWHILFEMHISSHIFNYQRSVTPIKEKSYMICC